MIFIPHFAHFTSNQMKPRTASRLRRKGGEERRVVTMAIDNIVGGSVVCLFGGEFV